MTSSVVRDHVSRFLAPLSAAFPTQLLSSLCLLQSSSRIRGAAVSLLVCVRVIALSLTREVYIEPAFYPDLFISVAKKLPGRIFALPMEGHRVFGNVVKASLAIYLELGSIWASATLHSSHLGRNPCFIRTFVHHYHHIAKTGQGK